MIKVRAWDVDSSEMIYSEESNRYYDFFFQFDSDGVLQLMSPKGDDFAEKRKSIMMLYIGLPDKKDKEIYKGDILLYPDGSTKEVVFIEGSFGVVTIVDERKSFGSNSRFASEGEVIGNIFENPELLNTKS